MPRKGQKRGEARDPIPLKTRVRVFWAGDQEWFHGAVVDYNPKRVKQYFVSYDDGEEIWEKEEDIQLLSSRHKKGTQQRNGQTKTPKQMKDVVGCRVEVYWQDMGESFQGVVTTSDERKGCQVLYDDGELVWEPRESLRILSKSPPNARRSPRSIGNSSGNSVTSDKASRTSSSRRLSNETVESTRSSKRNRRADESSNVPARRNPNRNNNSCASLSNTTTTSTRKVDSRSTATTTSKPRGSNRKNSASSASTTSTTGGRRGSGNMCNDDNEWKALGRRVRVFWDGENEYFFGVVQQACTRKGYLVSYEDGDEAWETRKSVEFVDGLPQPPSPPSRRNSAPAYSATGIATVPKPQTGASSKLSKKRKLETAATGKHNNSRSRREVVDEEEELNQPPRKVRSTDRVERTSTAAVGQNVEGNLTNGNNVSRNLNECVGSEVELATRAGNEKGGPLRGYILRYLNNKGFCVLCHSCDHSFVAQWVPVDSNDLVIRNSAPEKAETVLNEALACSNQEVVLFLIQNANVLHERELRVGHQKFSLFHTAALHGHDAVVQECLRQGANVNSRSGSNGNTALILACQQGNLDTVKQLLSIRGIDVNIVNKARQTALISAAINGHGTIVRQLLLSGSDANIKGPRNQTAFDIACSRGYPDVILALLGHSTFKLELKRDTLYSVFQIVQDLLLKNPFESECDIDGLLKAAMERASPEITPLTVAIECNAVELVDRLILLGADPNQAMRSGRYPLMDAVESGHSLLCEKLIKAGAELGVALDNGQSILSWACSLSNAPMATLNKLLDVATCKTAASKTQMQRMGAKQSDKIDKKESGKVDMKQPRLFIDPKKKNKTGKTSNSGPSKEKSELTVETGKRGPKLHTPELQHALLSAIQHARRKVVKVMIEKGIETDAKDSNGWCALKLACLHGDVELVNELILAGADINHTNNNGESALTWSAFAGRVEVAKLLLNHGALCNVTDLHGMTPLMWAARLGRTEVVSLLLQHGAETNIADSSGLTPLMWAKRCSHADVASVIEANSTLHKLTDALDTVSNAVQQGITDPRAVQAN